LSGAAALRRGRAAALLLFSFAAAAHDFPHPKKDLLRLSPEKISVLVEYVVSPGAPAQSLRAAFAGNRAALLQHLARTAALRTRVTVDGVEVALSPQPPRGEGLDDPRGSTALLAVRLELRAAWPPGSGDWRGRRKIVLEDEDQTGHVAASAACSGCRIADATSGAWEKAPGEERVLGAQTPLTLLVRLP
jgi:hypothetical protein